MKLRFMTMTKFAVHGAKMVGPRRGRLALGFGLAAGALILGMTRANADVRPTFVAPDASAQVVTLESPKHVVGAEDLAHERARGYTPGALAAPGGDSNVAVILWDDAWSELQRRARSASAVASTGSNAGTSIAGSSGGRPN